MADLVKQLTQNIVEPENLIQRLEEMAEPKDYQYFVAVKEGRVIGFAGLAWYPIPSKGLTGWIEEVVVDKEHRGQGAGQALMANLLELAQKLSLSQVKLTTADPVALHIYEKCGFMKKDEQLLVKK